MAEICFVKNVSGKDIPGKDEKGKELKPPTYNGNDGYKFRKNETKALSRIEAEFLCRYVPGLQIVATHGEKGESIPEQVIGTAKALEHFGIGTEGQPGQPDKK